MAEDRMLSDEILLGLIKNGGGGGGGTTNYNQLENKPQISGVTLQGDKSLADLGIASAQSVSNITNGQNINNFAGVETALDGVGTALALKQNATDNSLETTAKTIVGAINENAGDISSLKSGLTNATTVSSGTITAQEGITITRYILQKSIKTVFLFMLVKFTPTLGTGQLLCVLPSGYRAPDRLLFVGKNGTTGKLVTCETDSYGAVRVYPSSDDSTEVSTDYFLTITYFVS